MKEKETLHRIEEDLSETWLENWAGAGVVELEARLAIEALLDQIDARRAAVNSA